MLNGMKKIFIVLCLCCVSPFAWSQPVSLRQVPLTLPTCEIGAPDANSIFFTGRVYQGAQGHIYPYPLYDILTDRKMDKVCPSPPHEPKSYLGA
jgi:hypothetical protein